MTADNLCALYYFARVEQFDRVLRVFFFFKVTGNAIRFVSFNMEPYGRL